MSITATSNHQTDRRFRVAQWATGRVGMRCLRGILQHPAMDLVGLNVHSESKEGMDAGELCGLDASGVLATRNIDAIIRAQPDCVMYMQEGVDAVY